MKKLILLLTIIVLSKIGNSQINPLDTMLIREPVTVQAQDWLLCRGKVGASKDSAIIRFDKSVNRQVLATQGLTMTTNVPIDSIPAKLMVRMYYNLKEGLGELPTAQATRIYNAFRGVVSLTAEFNRLDNIFETRRQAAIAVGKYIFVDQ